MFTKYLADQAASSLENRLPESFTNTNRSVTYNHWSIHLSNLGALAMAVTAVATGILGFYPLTALCAVSSFIHFIAGHYIKEFLVYKDFEVANEQLKNRLEELERSEKELKNAAQELESAKHHLSIRLSEHEAISKVLQERFKESCNKIHQSAENLAVIKVFSDHMDEAAHNIETLANKTEAELKNFDQELKLKEEENRKLTQEIEKLNFTIAKLSKRLNDSDNDVLEIKKLLAAQKNNVTKEHYNSVLQKLTEAGQALHKLLEDNQALKTAKKTLATELTALKANLHKPLQ